MVSFVEPFSETRRTHTGLDNTVQDGVLVVGVAVPVVYKDKDIEAEDDPHTLCRTATMEEHNADTAAAGTAADIDYTAGMDYTAGIADTHTFVVVVAVVYVGLYPSFDLSLLRRHLRLR